uniref:Uncharacterized protein n=1 Tax=Nelumbo nucifera TaxID=4432 RepID=A0A822YT04_NELNU|nr:TPA_asm: hypothetical protein HUJ06_011209 [Nelumbo nucifera]
MYASDSSPVWVSGIRNSRGTGDTQPPPPPLQLEPGINFLSPSFFLFLFFFFFFFTFSFSPVFPSPLQLDPVAVATSFLPPSSSSFSSSFYPIPPPPLQLEPAAVATTSLDDNRILPTSKRRMTTGTQIWIPSGI